MSSFHDLFIHWRHIRILGYASPEMVMTAVLAYFWAQHTMRSNPNLSFVYSFFNSFYKIVMVSIGIHIMVGANTQLLYQLGLSCPPDLDSLSGIFPCPNNGTDYNGTLTMATQLANGAMEL